MNKEELMLQAMKNLYKEIGFKNLAYQLDTKQITEEEYDKELEENESKYVIDAPSRKASLEELSNMIKIIEEIGRTDLMCIDDVEQLFGLSIDHELLNFILSAVKPTGL